MSTNAHRWQELPGLARLSGPAEQRTVPSGSGPVALTPVFSGVAEFGLTGGRGLPSKCEVRQCRESRACPGIVPAGLLGAAIRVVVAVGRLL